MFGMTVLLLDHVGRKSGRRRTTPLLYLADSSDLVVVASRGGSDWMPAWWLNLKSTPRATVTFGRTRRDVIAREASPGERAALWPRLLAAHPDYALYEKRTSRKIPVIILSPADQRTPHSRQRGRTGSEGSISEGFSTNALLHAIAGPDFHSGFFAGKLTEVMSATTPSDWRMNTRQSRCRRSR
jgi:deazaflavin-dependent oxidoreductase (nitroreductase family)